MTNLELMLRILMALPPIHTGTPATPTGPGVAGSGTLLIASCTPGELVIIQPGTIQATADKEGVVLIDAPAQNPDADSYRFATKNGYSTFNGTLAIRQSLTATCP